ncbi:CoA-binding protein [Candidatus Woesearchaeota archaeon]|nr:CoA-binding protein [Candidatus Woesearchaeota archaeon]
MGDLDNFFYPKSVAVIGASNKFGKVGNALMHNLKMFKGKVFPVNLNENKVLGIKAYKSVLDIKKNIDLGVIAIPEKGVYSVLEECGKKEIKNVIIITAGFGETGNNEGQNRLIQISKKYNIRILGPNNFGNVNPYIDLDTSFSKLTPEKGNIALISQSGALWVYISQLSLGQFGFSIFSSLGNMIDVDFADIIEYLNNDKNTKVIVCYIETLKDGKKFMDICRKSKKPIIAIKAGATQAGQKAALSHTGSLAGEIEIYKAAFKQCGVHLVETVEDAFDKAQFLVNQNLKGNKTVIITNGGGLGVLCADYCAKNNLDVVKLPDSLIRHLDLSHNWSRNNPIDLVGDADHTKYKEIFLKLEENHFFDNVIIILSQQEMIDVYKVSKEIVNFRKRSKKNVVCCLVGIGENIDRAKKLLKENGILSYFEPERCAKVLKTI